MIICLFVGFRQRKKRVLVVMPKPAFCLFNSDAVNLPVNYLKKKCKLRATIYLFYSTIKELSDVR